MFDDCPVVEWTGVVYRYAYLTTSLESAQPRESHRAVNPEARPADREATTLAETLNRGLI
jgi:hypothetical protein